MRRRRSLGGFVFVLWMLGLGAFVLWARSYTVSDYLRIGYWPSAAADGPASGVYFDASSRSGQFMVSWGIGAQPAGRAWENGFSFHAGQSRPAARAWYGRDRSLGHQLGFFFGGRDWAYTLLVPGWALALWFAATGIAIKRIRRLLGRGRGRDDLYYRMLLDRARRV